MSQKEDITKRVHECYWNDNMSCAKTVMKVIGELKHMEIHPQTMDAALGLAGAGRYGAQCGLLEGALMLIGIIGREKGMPVDVIEDICREFAEQFEKTYGSLQCSQLRPEGFSDDNPPHMCEGLTIESIAETMTFLDDIF